MQTLSPNRKMPKAAGILLLAVSVFWIGFRFGMDTTQAGLLETMRGFTLILWSILLEAFPFVLLGIVVSSVIQVFVTEDMILKIMPRNRFLRLLFASLVGLIFPVCECAIIPITSGLIKKGMPVGPAITFMLATPIINPIVLLSTYNAFPAMPQMMLLRAACGLIGAVAIGALVGRFKTA
ncbi:MAG: permease, partial [Firmicutes bacterium]|nr:permease [Bacillota bacterium]